MPQIRTRLYFNVPLLNTINYKLQSQALLIVIIDRKNGVMNLFVFRQACCHSRIGSTHYSAWSEGQSAVALTEFTYILPSFSSLL